MYWIILVLSLLSQRASAADADLAQQLMDPDVYLATEPDDADELPEPWMCDPAAIASDLRDPTTARFQINSNLALFASYKEQARTTLSGRIICVGTGRNPPKTKQITTVRHEDVTIDVKSRVAPTINVDAFDIPHLGGICGEGTFSGVFFAHVGDSLPINCEKFSESLRRYFRVLKPGGLFLYNSEVHANIDLERQSIIKLHSFRSKVCMERAWRESLQEAGFIEVDSQEKDESKIFGGLCASFLLVAKKPSLLLLNAFD